MQYKDSSWLACSHRSYFPVFAEIRSGDYKAPFISKLSFVTNFFGNFILKSVMPSAEKKIKTFPIWEPQTGKLETDTVEKFIRHQNELIQEFQSFQPFLEKRQTLSSPANKNIVYTLDKALEIIVTHEERHLQTCKRILASMKT